MSRRAIVVVLLAGFAGVGVAAPAGAGERHGWVGAGHGRWSALSREDRAAFADARLAALHAGLKLNPEQETLWPPVETAIRDLFAHREARRQARRESGRASEDAPARLRRMADAATARGEVLRRLADATAPLHATLDEGQKRRAAMLVHPMRPGGGWHHRRGGRDGSDGKDD